MNCGVLGDLLQVANAFGDLRHYEHTECGIVVSHFDVEQQTRSNHLDGEDIQHEGYESHDALPWNRNQSDELEERWRQENEQTEYFDVDEDMPDFDQAEDEEQELWPDEEEDDIAEYQNLSKNCWYCGAKLVDGKCPIQEEGHRRETS